MVTAVQNNMVGILRRFHLYPMDTALNELNSQDTLNQLRKFDVHSFLFHNSPNMDLKSSRLSAKQQNPCFSPICASPPITDHQETKQFNRSLRSSQRHTVQSVSHDLHRDDNMNLPSSPERHRFEVAALNDSIRANQTPSSPPTLYPANQSSGKRNSMPPHSWLDHPPTLSNPRSPLSTHHGANFVDTKFEPILVTAASFLEARTPLIRSNVCTTLNSKKEDRSRSLSGTSNGENLSDTTESTTSMPNVNCSTLTTEVARKIPAMGNSDVSTCSSRIRHTTRMAVTESSEPKKIFPTKRGTPHSQSTSDSNTQSNQLRPLKRRRSYEQLNEPSIHDLIDHLPEARSHERHSTQLLQVSPPLSPVRLRPVRVPLKTCSTYYLPDFSVLQNRKRIRDHSTHGVNLGSDMADLNSDCVTESIIEVPSWRINPLSVVLQSINSVHTKRASNPQLYVITPDHESSPCLRRRRTGACEKQPLNASNSILTATEMASESNEDTSDSAYVMRHSRLESEEIRRERRSRQRTFEQELKQRIELRDQMSWRKRQQGRLDPLSKYDPEQRIPDHLSVPFNQIRHFHVRPSLPVIAFGACVTSPTLMSVKTGSP